MLECDIAFDIVELLDFAAFFFHFVLVDDFENTLGSSCGTLQRVSSLCKLAQRLCELANVNHERDNHAKGNIAIHCEHCTNDANYDVTKIANESHEWLHETAHKLALPGTIIKFAVDSTEVIFNGCLCVIGFNDWMTRIGFFNLAIKNTKRLLLFVEVFL